MEETPRKRLAEEQDGTPKRRKLWPRTPGTPETPQTRRTRPHSAIDIVYEAFFGESEASGGPIY